MTEIDDWLTPTPRDEAIAERESARSLLLHDILRGELRNARGEIPSEGDPLSEQQVVTDYGAKGIHSRMPVRMALAVLATEGLVRQRARHGFWIADVDFRALQQIGQLRAGTDAMIAESLHAAIHPGGSASGVLNSTGSFERATQALKKMWRIASDLRTSLPEFAAVSRDDEGNFADLDTEFHASLAHAADYDIAARHIVEWRNLMRLYRLQKGIQYTVPALTDICSEHETLIQAIGEPSASPAECARAHVRAAVERCAPKAVVLEALAREPDRVS
jgi:DNA-binding GntR family transcriptional regulator